MKKLIVLFSLTLSFSTLASSVDTKTFVYDGYQNSVELILNAEKTHTEYRVEDVRTICYRQEISGYRTVCSGNYGPRRPGPGPNHPRYPYPNRNCYSTPIYRQVSYPCTQTVRTPYQVKDYDVNARVIIDVTKVSPAATPGEVFKVTLNGDTLSFDVIGSKKFFIVKKYQDIRSSMSGSVKMMDAILATDLIEAAPVLSALEVSNLTMKDSVLSFRTSSGSQENIGYNLTIKKSPLLGSETVMFDRELIPSEVSTSGEGVNLVNINHLGVKLSSGRYALTAKAFAKFDGNLMNSDDFATLSASRTLIYKIR